MSIENSQANGAAAAEKISPLLKIVLELGPLAVFFFANARGEWLAEKFPVLAEFGGPIFIATGLFMIATATSLIVSWIMTRTVPAMPLVSGIFVLVLGALTIWLQNETFIKIKPTIVNALFGVILLGGLPFGKTPLGYVFGHAFRLEPEGWMKLTLRWGLFFLFLAVLNEVVWRNFSTDTWAAFKVWGTMPITILFTMFQMPLIQRYSLDHQITEGEGKE